MLRLLAAGFVFLAVASTRADAQCDPYTQEQKIKIPPALQLATTCGNGRIDTYATECVQRVSGGCGYPTQTSKECVKTQEVCDGRAFGDNTCKAFGFVGGSLRCASSCQVVDYSQCTVCAAAKGCRERAVRWNQFEDITLLAQGEAVRAFWYDATHYYVADIDKRGALGKSRELAVMGSTRLIPTLVGTSAITMVGTEDNLQLSVVPAKGAPSLVPVPGRMITFFMPIIPTSTPDLALAITGDLVDGTILLVDPTGKSRPLTAVYGQNAYRRAALIPIDPGKHTLRWATVEVDVTAQKGDFLFVMYDYTTNAVVVRNGRAVRYDGPARTLTTESKDVLLDGKQVASFGPSEDVIGTVKHARAAAIAPTAQVLAPLVYERKLVSIARTSKLEVQAARVPRSDDSEADHTLAIAVVAP
ncbi:MAG: hypothetical protein HOV81_05625 [Kofleriaceae bacterium]|nr:hypothetical protein [Kofleriaceae bacterium]